MNWTSVGLPKWRLMGSTGSSGESHVPLHSAETKLMRGLWWERESEGRALTSKTCGPQPVVTFSREQKLALECG